MTRNLLPKLIHFSCSWNSPDMQAALVSINSMEILSGVASKLGELLTDATINQARYLFCFNSIIKELGDKETNLKEAQDGVNEKVEQDRQKHRAVVVEKDVEKWLADVVKEMANVQNLKAKIDENKSCLNGRSPNWCCRYWLGRKALKKTSKLADLLDRGKFSTVAHPKPLPSNRELSAPRHFMSFETTELACNQIIEALKKDSTKMVGLHGLGGVGKTTLAKFAGNQLRQQKIFDDVGIATISRDPNIINVQSELVKSLGWALMEKDEKDRADRLRLMFSESKSPKILIILDDVWNELDLETIGIPVGDRDNCCKILLTTRLQPVCDRMGCDTQIQLGVLKREEGLALLRKHAGIDADSTLIGVSEQIANECKGLPLAIKAVGSALRGKGFGQWKVALHKLKNAKLNTIEGIGKDDQDVYHCLKFSYDYLNERVVEESLEQCKGISLVGNKKEELPTSLVCPNLQILQLQNTVYNYKLKVVTTDGLAERAMEQYEGISFLGYVKEELPSGYDYQFHVPEHFFEGMPALKVVTVIGGVISLKSLQFLTNLQVLQLIQCKVSDASFLGKLKRLQILCVKESPIEIPEELGDQLSRLKLLIFINSGCISPITIKKFPQLEEFYGRIKDWEAEGMSSEENDDGKTLHTDKKIARLPKDFTFPKLQRHHLKSLYVSECRRMECIIEAKFDHNDGEISVGDGNKMLALPLLTKLTLHNLPKLKSFCSENYCSIWTALEESHLRHCPNLTVSSTELEANLQYLEEGLKSLFKWNDTIPALLKHGLKNLEDLKISQLGVHVVFQLEAIIAEGQENKLFLCLKSLQLKNLPELQVLYHEGPTHIFSLQNLTRLLVIRCSKLKRLLSSTLARNLLQLEELSVRKCLELEQIIDEDEDEDHLQPVCFPKLRRITFYNCPKLKHLFHISVAPSLQNLTQLWVESNYELEEVFWHKDGADVTDYNEIVTNELQGIELINLPNLTNFWPAGYPNPIPPGRFLGCPKLRANSEGNR
ncbi:hypothetical protein CUMW_227470 [Citrus unshiu]|uniref:AAA+ ATPase domain-containing protein n=1 Tax=Citrus unshiu TaxID=55188 RepID=A0A2H5QGA8_CITUN|nr:hypothetical protein CUMW_227470 [Citrus unshiu]